MKEPEDEKSASKVPLRDGRPENFQHYVQEVKWFLAATKASERPYAAARLIRRMLQSEYSALKSLMYKLDPSDFSDEQGIQKLVSFLEASPMNRQPIPDAGAKLSQYYRRLSRKNNETIPQFLVREDSAYDSMWKALQRLLREKALDFSKYEVTEAELKTFCGMDPNVSYYVPGDLDGDDHPDSESGSQRSHTTVKPDDDQGSKGFSPQGSSKKGSSSRSDPAPRPIKKKKDLIERLMEKGLIPLAALDIIRGWMVLEMASSSDMDKALVKASTQNKLGYDSIRQALLAMHEDRDRQSGVGHKGKAKGTMHIG